MTRRINIRDEYQNKFYQLPKLFFTNERYIKMSNNAKIAWAILRDRSNLSAKNNWVDDNGDIYFIYTNDNLMEILNIASKATLQKVKKELMEAELLEQERRGLQKANRLYLLNPVVTEKDIYLIEQSEQAIEAEKQPFNKKEDKTSNINRSTINELQFSESRGSINELQEVQKMNTNDTELSKTESKDNKDNKETQADNINALFNFSIKEKDKDSDQKLIDFMIEERQLDILFGDSLVYTLRAGSRGSFDLFKEWIDLVLYAIKSVEEERKTSLFIHLYDTGDNAFAYEFRKDLTRTVHDVLFRIRTDKYEKIKDQKSYLFASVKKTAEQWSENANNL